MFLGQWNSKGLRKHWNKIAKQLGDFSEAPSTIYYKESEINLIKKYFGDITGSNFLKIDLWNEVNNTKILFWIAGKNAKVYGIDISDYLVKKTRKKFAKAGIKGKFISCDMRKLEFPNNKFDFVYTMGTVEHVYDYEAAIREIFRVLKPGGKAIIGIPNKHDPFLRPFMVWFLELFNLYPYAPEQSFTRNELSNLLKGAGFKIQEHSGLLFMPGILRITDLFLHTRMRSLSKITQILLKPFEYLERNYEWARKNGYLICCIVKKPK